MFKSIQLYENLLHNLMICEVCTLAHLSMFRLRRIEIGANPQTAGEVDSRHEISDEHIGLVDELHVEEMGERLHVQHRHNVRVHAYEQRERRGYVGPKNRAVVLADFLLEEALWPLEPEVLQPVP